MKAWIFVEGLADKLGLEALWSEWQTRLREENWAIEIIPLANKANFLRKLGARAAEKLVGGDHDVVVGLPDLYPTFSDAGFRHSDVMSLKAIQRDAVRVSLREIFRISSAKAVSFMLRFFPSAFRHDFEMLLLAAVDDLRKHLGTTKALETWRVPVEDQDLERPPKRLVEELFLTKSSRRRAYRDTKDAPAILRSVKKDHLRAVLRTKSGQWTCPEFVALLKWLGEQTNVPVCDLRDRTK